MKSKINVELIQIDKSGYNQGIIRVPFYYSIPNLGLVSELLDKWGVSIIKSGFLEMKGKKIKLVS